MDSLYLRLVPLDKAPQIIEQYCNIPAQKQTPNDLISTLKKNIAQLHQQSFLTASVDSLTVVDSTYIAHLFIGEKYEWASLKNGNIPDALLRKIGFKERFYAGQDFHYTELYQLQEKLLKYAEDNGFPFAQTWLDSLQITDNTIAARLYFDSRQAITFAPINIVTETKLSERYLAGYLGIQSGDAYNETQVKRISGRLRELPFLTESRSPNVTFEDTKATVNLFLKNRKASRFDFLVGFLPNNAETGRLLLTGNAELDLKNPFGTGKEIRVEWEQLRAGTQRLEAHFLYPYILGQPFGVEFDFNLYKRDSSYLDLERDIGIQYHLEGGNYLKIYWNTIATNLLEINEAQIVQSRQLPSNIDIRNSTFGLAYRLQQLDYRFNPRKGFDVLLRAGAGAKRISENQKILSLEDPFDPQFQFQSLYDTLALRSFQYRLEADVARFWQLGQRSTLKTGVRSAWLISENPLYQNELLRIGGNQILRGFDEESVFASLYAIFTAEYRLLIGRNSYIYAFGDYGLVQQKSVENTILDQPFGFGAGITFETRAGVFGISYALGRQLDNPIDFRSGKIHFGYVSLF